MGGTLDIRTFYLPLRHLAPVTFNIAINLRTRVKLQPYKKGMVKVSSKGFEAATVAADALPFDHRFGLIFNAVAYFGVAGLHIDIHSESPPKSALGGSSSAMIALTAGLAQVMHRRFGAAVYSPEQLVQLAHAVEECVAGVTCGHQDQLAAAFGGINAWHWTGDFNPPLYRRQALFEANNFASLEPNLLLAYCGVQHASKDINGTWIRQFLSGRFHTRWGEMIGHTRSFVNALEHRDFTSAAGHMNAETAIRRELTPAVLDGVGQKLVDTAVNGGCGARFTGAGGGGCIWALGPAAKIQALGAVWSTILAQRPSAKLLDFKIDADGLQVAS